MAHARSDDVGGAGGAIEETLPAGQREEVLPVIGEIEKEYQKVIEQIQKLD